MLQEANQLFEPFPQMQDKWNAPFPMGVFGTLRLNCGNDRLMKRIPYKSHHKAFLPHFYAQGLGIHCRKDCSAVFEIFTYKPTDWLQMIQPVDGLEGFSPTRSSYRGYGYWRTLVMLHVLPDDYISPFYEPRNLWHGERTLEIPPQEWDNYPKVPCWVYSSLNENKKAEQIQDHTILWYGDDINQEEN